MKIPLSSGTNTNLKHGKNTLRTGSYWINKKGSAGLQSGPIGALKNAI